MHGRNGEEAGASRSSVSRTQLRPSLRVHNNMNRRFINSRFHHPTTLDHQQQRASFTSNNDIGDFVNIGDVMAVGNEANGDDTYFLTQEELNQYMPQQ